MYTDEDSTQILLGGCDSLLSQSLSTTWFINTKGNETSNYLNLDNEYS